MYPNLHATPTCVTFFPSRSKKIKIQILINLSGGSNIIAMLDVVRDEHTRIPALVLEYVDAIQFKNLTSIISDFEIIRFYIHQLLKALDYAHSNGVMHHDVKPGNVLIDHNKKILRLIDWGLAEFYHEHKDYSVRIRTKFYKAELLVGCMVTALIFKSLRRIIKISW